MFSHVTLGVADIERAIAFYRPLMQALGWVERFAGSTASDPWAGWNTPGKDRPLFIVTEPVDGASPAAGNGTMVAFDVADRSSVDAVHARALALGGTDEGAPGPRPHYHADYYGGYFRDPDGNKLCVVCHAGAAPAATI